MSIEFVFRLIGMVVFAVIAFRLAVFLGGDWNDVRVISALTLAGAALGLIITPWLTIRPFLWMRNRIQGMPASQLIAAIIGLVIGLAVAALLTPALSNLPPPLGDVMPFVASVVFG